jgi:hypothetical protein
MYWNLGEIEEELYRDELKTTLPGTVDFTVIVKPEMKDFEGRSEYL